MIPARQQLLVRNSARVLFAPKCFPKHRRRSLLLSVATFATKQPVHKHPRIPAFEVDQLQRNTGTDGDDAGTGHMSEENRDTLNSIMGQFVCPGSEMDVRIVKVTKDYALCRPVDIPEAKGKISREEMDEHDEVWDATDYLSTNMIYTASVLHVHPPDRLILSLRRVRRVLQDDFQPFTIAIFGLPEGFDENNLQEIMEESGKVLDVEASSLEKKPIAFVTFQHQEHGIAAMKKWNAVGKMRCVIGDDSDFEEEESPDKNLYRIRCKKAHRQQYRETLQNFLDVKLQQKVALWDETPYERRCRLEADVILADLIPWYYQNKMYEIDSSDITESSTAFKFSVKNNPRQA